MKNQWTGKKAAYLGDSITDAAHVGTTKNYWQFLEEHIGLKPLVYGLNGWQFSGIPEQAAKLRAEHGDDVDAIFVFMGTNDFNAGIPLGNWYEIRTEEVNSHGKMMPKPRRYYSKDPATFRGRINIGLAYLKEHFPRQQIILMTPIHRGFATFGGDNVQPEDSFPNDIGLYVEEYIRVLREAADIWSVPLIDLFRESGLLPSCDVYAPYFHLKDTDRLHPNAAGHERLAKVILYHLLAMPSSFR